MTRRRVKGTAPRARAPEAPAPAALPETRSTEAQASEPGVSRLPYEQFLAERRAIVEARQRAQQRFDQLVTAGAAGTLVLSINFLDHLASGVPTSVPLLLWAWGILLLSLLATLLSHYFGQEAFDCFLRDFDDAFAAGTLCDGNNGPARISRGLTLGSAGLFIVGVILMAAFAYANLPLTPQLRSDGATTTAAAATHSSVRAAAPHSTRADPTHAAAPAAAPGAGERDPVAAPAPSATDSADVKRVP